MTGLAAGVRRASVQETVADLAAMLGSEDGTLTVSAVDERSGTAFGTMGTITICEVVATDADVLLEFVGRSLAYTGANGYLVQLSFAEVVIALNPVWAALIGKVYPDIADVRRILWEHASIPLSEFPRQHQRQYEDIGWVDERGRVPLTRKPEDVIVMVAGGLGGLHAAALHSWGTTIAQTRAVRP
jgi:hypothetical protein